MISRFDFVGINQRVQILLIKTDRATEPYKTNFFSPNTCIKSRWRNGQILGGLFHRHEALPPTVLDLGLIRHEGPHQVCDRPR